MHFSFAPAEFDRIVCIASDGHHQTTITSSQAPDAAAGLLDAVNQAGLGGLGECLWPEATGQYRWMFRRDGDSLRVAVLWSSGTLTGWEHVLWTEVPLAAFAAHLREELAFATTRCSCDGTAS